MSERNGLEIAIIGMAGRFPRAGDLERFWQNLREGLEVVSFFTAEEVLVTGLPPSLVADPSFVRAAAILEDPDLFDAAFFDFAAREAEVLDPQHRILLEHAWQALERAGYAGTRRPVGVFVGAAQSTYALNNLFANPEVVSSVGMFSLALANEKDFLATRLAYKLDLSGPAYTVQTACSTSLAAVHLACQSLLVGDCELALAGGVAVKFPQKSGYLYQPGGISSPDGHCRSFDARAQGSVGGQGVGLVLLKPLENALADGDHIHAVIKGSASNNDGMRGKAGYTAPSRDGQARAIRAAQLRAEVEPDTIGYVEAHGTATPLGDPIEVAALTRAFRQGTNRRGFCAIGSVKSNMGHLDAAAGVAGLIKAVLAVERGEIPPTVHFETPNPQIDFAASPFYVPSRLVDWKPEGLPRRAGVSSFGMGGTNIHVVLEEAPPAEPSGPSRPWQVLSLSARTPEALERLTDDLAAHLAASPDQPLADVAFTLHTGRKAFEHRRVLIATDAADAAAALGARDPRRVWTSEVEPGDRPIAFLLSGVGDHYAGMARGLYESEEVFRREFDRCAELLRPELGLDLREAVFSGDRESGGLDLRALAGRGGASLEGPLRETRIAQPAVFAVSWALAQLWRSWGVRPQAVAGYSLGEYTAACLAGVMELAEALAFVARRAALIGELPEGAMLAVPLAEEEARARLSPGLSLAAVNGPGVSVVSGPASAVAELEARLAGEGLACRRLPTTHAFHSAMMEPARDAVAGLAGRFRLAAPKVALLSNLTGTWMGPEETGDPGYWSRHLCGTVRFGQAVEALWSEPGRILLEVGPGQGLTTLALQHPSSRGVAIPSLPHAQDRQPDRLFLLGALGKLWLAGVEVDWEGFYAGETRRRLPLPTYPFERKRYWIEPPRRDARAALSAAAATASAGSGETVAAPALPAPAAVQARHARPRLRNAYVPPAAGSEERLVVLWQTLLGVEPIGIHDDFFELGGHSLLGTQMLARLRAEAGIELPLSILFEGPTVAALAAAIERPGGIARRPPVRPRPPEAAELPLAFVQQRLWFLDQLEPGNPFYNIATLYHLRGPVEAPLVERAWNEIVRRHESLRTTFAAPEGRPVQVLAAALWVPLAVVDLSALPAAVRAGEAKRQAREAARVPFDLARGPLLRMTLLRLGAEDHALGVVMHHIVSDGWSFQVALAELIPLYAALHAGRPSPLPELAVQYPDYALWQHDWLEGGALADQLAWWTEALAGAPPTLDLPADRPRPAVQTYRGATERVWLGRERVEALARLSVEAGASSFMTLLAAFATLLYRHSGQDDVVLGSPIANRSHQETELLIGFFVNTLVLRTDLAGDPPFRDLLARVRRHTIGAYDHQDLPFDRLVEALRPERSLSHTPLFQVIFQLLNQPQRAAAPTGLSIETWPVDLGISTFDLTFSLAEGPGGMLAALEYNTDLFERPTIRRLLAHFDALLAGIAAGPGLRLSELPLLSAAEVHQLQVDWNDTATERSGSGLIHRLFEARARERPDDPAIVFEDRCVSYSELDLLADRLADGLRALGVGPETAVGLFAERSPEAIAGMLGILKAGGFYVPVDPDYPAERIELTLRDAGVRAVLTQERIVAALPDLGVPVVHLDTDRGPITTTPDIVLSEDAPAYVIYTSGSMGRPKGVVARHRSLVNFSLSIAGAVGLGPGDRMLEFASLSFDASALQIFPTLISGAALVLDRNPGRLSPAEIRELCERQGVTVLDLPAAVWRQWIDEMAGGDEKLLPQVRAFLTGGESLPADRVRSWALLPAREARLFSSYGPTEATVTTTLFGIGSHAAQSLAYIRLPLGRPLPDTRVHVLDAHGRPVSIGVPGEVCIGGDGLARGYLHEPALTAQAFVPFSGSTEPGERLYRTGDLARRLPDGQLEFLGRADHQVKIRGFRVELGEIEALLASHPAVREAVVLLREDAPGDRRLVAYVLPEPDAVSTSPTAPELRAFVAGALPDFMVPAFFVLLAELPLLPSGKVNRRALPAPDGARPSVAAEFVAPRDPVEQVLAGLWAQILKMEKVGVRDNFFELGGHSLLATQVLTRVRQTFELGADDLPLRRLFEAPTVAGLAAALLALPERREKVLATAELMLQLTGMSEDEVEAMLMAEAVAGEGGFP